MAVSYRSFLLLLLFGETCEQWIVLCGLLLLLLRLLFKRCGHVIDGLLCAIVGHLDERGRLTLIARLVLILLLLVLLLVMHAARVVEHMRFILSLIHVIPYVRLNRFARHSLAQRWDARASRQQAAARVVEEPVECSTDWSRHTADRLPCWQALRPQPLGCWLQASKLRAGRRWLVRLPRVEKSLGKVNKSSFIIHHSPFQQHTTQIINSNIWHSRCECGRRFDERKKKHRPESQPYGVRSGCSRTTCNSSCPSSSSVHGGMANSGLQPKLMIAARAYFTVSTRAATTTNKSAPSATRVHERERARERKTQVQRSSKTEDDYE